jgi:hypothetical protein
MPCCTPERSPRLLPALALLCAALAMPAQAQAQWMWRDKDGQVNASDRPPPKDIPDKDILGRPVPESRRYAPAPPPMLAASAPGTPLDRELQARKRAAEQEQAARFSADAARTAAQRAENCRNARSHQAALETGQRMARVNEKGEREALDDKGRAEEQRRAREIIASDCR